MNGLSDKFAQVLKLDSPAAIWKFWNWLPLILLWPYLVFIALLDVGISWMKLAVTLFCGAVLCIAYYILRAVLVSKGTARNDLDAISKGIGRSSAITGLIGTAISFVTVVSILLFMKANGEWEALVIGANLIIQFVIAIAIGAISVFIGWRVKGQQVYEKYVPKLKGGEIQ